MGLRMMPFFKGKKGFQFAGGGNVDKFDDLPVATTSSIGCVKADGTTINVNSSGTISTTALLKKSTMPEASASELGNIYMYTGADTDSFTSGHVYKCVSDEDPDTPIYSWSQVELEDPYTLPTATASTLGGVKVGNKLTIADGVINVPVTSGTSTVTGIYWKRYGDIVILTCYNYDSEDGAVTISDVPMPSTYTSGFLAKGSSIVGYLQAISGTGITLTFIPGTTGSVYGSIVYIA